SLLLSEGDEFRRVAVHNAPPALVEHWHRTPLVRPHPASAFGRAALTKQAVHVEDIRTTPAYLQGDALVVAGVAWAQRPTFNFRPEPVGGHSAGDGRQGSMKPAGAAGGARNSMRN